jgi:MFS transporter, DHA1 family, multidrug resistance protein
MPMRKGTVLIVLMLLNPISGVGIDISAPSLPSIASGLSASITQVQLILSIYVLGFGVGQIIVGNLSDSIGRKPVLVAGLLGTVITGILAGLSINVYCMLFMRFLQGLSVSAPGNLSKSIATDFFTKEEMVKVSSCIVLAWGLGPILAPLVGAYLQYYFGWRASFYFLSAYSAFVLILVLLIFRETNCDKKSISIKKIINRHLDIFSSKVFVGSALSMAIGYSVIIEFNTIAPFIVQGLLKYSVIFYGRLAFFLGIAFTAGTFSNLIFIRMFSERKILLSAIVVSIITAGIMFFFAIFNYLNIFIIFIPALIITYFIGCIYPHYMGKCISLFPKMAGAASATSGCTVMVSTALIATCSSLLPVNSQLPLAVIYFILSLLLGGVYLFLVGGIVRYSRKTKSLNKVS